MIAYKVSLIWEFNHRSIGRTVSSVLVHYMGDHVKERKTVFLFHFPIYRLLSLKQCFSIIYIAYSLQKLRRKDITDYIKRMDIVNLSRTQQPHRDEKYQLKVTRESSWQTAALLSFSHRDIHIL